MKRKKCYLVRHAYCGTECCTNCHCPSARSKTALLFPGLIAPLQRIHVQYTRLLDTYFLLSAVETFANMYFCENIRFAKQVMAHTAVHDIYYTSYLITFLSAYV